MLAEDYTGGFCRHWVRLGYKESCSGYRGRLPGFYGGYMGWLRTTKMAFVLTLVGLGHTECCDATFVLNKQKNYISGMAEKTTVATIIQ